MRALTVERVRRMIADMVADGLSSSSITGSRGRLLQVMEGNWNFLLKIP